MALGTGRAGTMYAARLVRRSLAVATLGATALAAGSLASASPASAKVTSSSRALVIKTEHVPSLGTVLATSTGRTLYRFAGDAPEKTMCTGTCAMDWLPLVLPKGDTKLKVPHGVKGLSLQRVAGSRSRIMFRHKALFHFVGDTKKGEANGQGVGGLWYAVLANGKSSAPKAAATSPAPGAGSGTTTTSKPTTGGTQATSSTAPATTKTSTTSPPTTAPPRTTTTTAPPRTTTTTYPPPTTTTTTSPPSGGVGF